MPYKSAKQRAFMHAKHPKIAARWDKETGGKVVAGKGTGRPKMPASMVNKMKSAKKTSGAPLPAKVAKPIVGKTAGAKRNPVRKGRPY